MTFTWEATRKAHKTRLAQTLKVLKSKKADKGALKSANLLASLVDKQYTRVAQSFNKIATRQHKQAFLHRPKTPTHTLSAKYAPTAMALVEFTNEHDIQLDRWLLAQFELITHPFLTLFQCYGENALVRYTAWEAKQTKKFVRTVDKAKQTDSKLDTIRDSILRGHVAAISWIPQLIKIAAPDLATGLYFILPNITGWYALCYAEFREAIMDNGLCDLKHMVAWYGKYQRSKAIRDTCAKALAEAQALFGNLEW